ncbi:hypothetical protein M3906_003528 [Vibrio metschnikovii]|nr:hypothetical protein [Vibrio metschnikovii]
MKTKTYNSRTLEITVEPSKLNIKLQELSEIENDFPTDAQTVKNYAEKPTKWKRKWFSQRPLSDVFLGAIVSTVLGLSIQALMGL